MHMQGSHFKKCQEDKSMLKTFEIFVQLRFQTVEYKLASS